MPIKRLNYFDHQFLIEADFTAQQNYHLNMRRHLNRVLHTFGIAEGLEVSKTANKAVTVKPGTAIDRDGREMLLEAARVIDLSDAVQFPASSTIFVIATYRETLSDQSTATGAEGHTRVTEEAIITAVRTPPASDGSVVRLATFKLDELGNVQGNINDSLDGGVRQRVGVRGIEQGLVSIDGVTSAGGNIDLIPTDSITITPDDANNRIRIGEGHSALKGNPHGLTMEHLGAIGAMTAADYDLRRRFLSAVSFNQENKDGFIPPPVNCGFSPKAIFVIGNWTAALSLRTYSGGISAFAFPDLANDGKLSQRCISFAMTKANAADVVPRSVASLNIANVHLLDQSVAPNQGEFLNVSISGLTNTGLTLLFNRAPIGTNAGLEKFQISLQLMIMG